MLLTALTKRFNQWLGPFLLQHGLRARCALSGVGVVTQDNVWLDHLVGLQVAKRLVSLHVREAADQAVAAAKTREAMKKKEEEEVGNTGSWKTWWNNLWLAPKQQQDQQQRATDNVLVHKSDSTPTRTKSAVTFSARTKTTKKQSPPKDPLLLSPDEEGQIRLRVLEKYIRPVLVPNETWSDVQKWQFHKRLLQWIRQEYLYAAHIAQVRAAFVLHPQLGRVQQLAPTRLSNMFSNAVPSFLLFDSPANTTTANASSSLLSYLPSTTLVKQAFELKDWANRKVGDATRKVMEPIVQRLGKHDDDDHHDHQHQNTVVTLRGGALCLPHIVNDHCNLAQLSLGEILELVGGHVIPCGPLNLVCEERGIFQLWTKEYIQGLGQYLQTRVEEFAMEEEEEGEGETLILDVGAGDGLLAQALRDYFQSIESNTTYKRLDRPLVQQSNNSNFSPGKNTTQRPKPRRVSPKVLATDNGSWGVSKRASTGMEKLDYKQALKKYCQVDDVSDQQPIQRRRQVIVLCSWMPMNEDWTAEFRKYSPTVQEYILIGECDDGQCGDNWATWGNVHMLSDVALELQEKMGPPTTTVTSEEQELADPTSPTTVTGQKLMSQAATATATQSKVEVEAAASPIAPHVNDNFVRNNLDHLVTHQFSRFDSSLCKAGMTVSFRCKKAL
ncbi:hypothetical protein ACA910_012703 [Epithemia clementina (nom. ined.)]